MFERKFVHLLVIMIYSGILYSCHSEAGSQKNVNRQIVNIRVEGIIVRPSVLDQTITISGTLKPFEETVLMPEVAGRVVDINIRRVDL